MSMCKSMTVIIIIEAIYKYDIIVCVSVSNIQLLYCTVYMAATSKSVLIIITMLLLFIKHLIFVLATCVRSSTRLYILSHNLMLVFEQ